MQQRLNTGTVWYVGILLAYCQLWEERRSIDRSMKMNRAFSVTSRKAWTKEERMDGSRLRRLVSSVCGELQNVMVSH
jgi:hypothetical protein